MCLIRLGLMVFAINSACCFQLKAGEQPNVLFIAVDDLNDWWVGLGGTRRLKLRTLTSWPDVACCLPMRIAQPQPARPRELLCSLAKCHRIPVSGRTMGQS